MCLDVNAELVWEIAGKLGFPEQFTFKKHAGTSPTDFQSKNIGMSVK